MSITDLVSYGLIAAAAIVMAWIAWRAYRERIKGENLDAGNRITAAEAKAAWRLLRDYVRQEVGDDAAIIRDGLLATRDVVANDDMTWPEHPDE